MPRPKKPEPPPPEILKDTKGVELKVGDFLTYKEGDIRAQGRLLQVLSESKPRIGALIRVETQFGYLLDMAILYDQIEFAPSPSPSEIQAKWSIEE